MAFVLSVKWNKACVISGWWFKNPDTWHCLFSISHIQSVSSRHCLHKLCCVSSCWGKGVTYLPYNHVEHCLLMYWKQYQNCHLNKLFSSSSEYTHFPIIMIIGNQIGLLNIQIFMVFFVDSHKQRNINMTEIENIHVYMLVLLLLNQ